jgi:hypothetical protein
MNKKPGSSVEFSTQNSLKLTGEHNFKNFPGASPGPPFKRDERSSNFTASCFGRQGRRGREGRKGEGMGWDEMGRENYPNKILRLQHWWFLIACPYSNIQLLESTYSKCVGFKLNTMSRK